MRVVRLHAPRDLRMHDEPVPEPGPGDVQVQIKSVGVCASDGHWYREGRIGSTVVEKPIVLGHEAGGIVTKLGEGVTELKVGDRVAIEPSRSCMQCEQCKTENYNVCPNVQFFGTPPTDGTFRDYVVWPARLAIPVSPKLSFDEIAMLEPLAVGLYAVNLAKIKTGDTVLVMGAGAIGLSVLQAAEWGGAKTIVVSEPIEARRRMATKLGASSVIDPSTQDASEVLADLNNGFKADVVFECTGEDDAVREACRLVRILGKVMVVGIPDSDSYCFDASQARRKQLRAIFVRRSNLATEKAIELVERGILNAGIMATNCFPLEKTKEALEMTIARADDSVRVMVEVN
jgi:L-iditol 2-dehydrogenase